MSAPRMNHSPPSTSPPARRPTSRSQGADRLGELLRRPAGGGPAWQAGARGAECGSNLVRITPPSARLQAELMADVVGGWERGVELSGRIATTSRCERAMATGCARVNLGHAALRPGVGQQAIADTATSSRSAWKCGHPLSSRCAAWTSEAASVSRCWARATPPAAPRYVVTPLPATAPSRHRNLQLLTTVLRPAPSGRSSPVGGVPRSPNLEARRPRPPGGRERYVGQGRSTRARSRSKKPSNSSQTVRSVPRMTSIQDTAQAAPGKNKTE